MPGLRVSLLQQPLVVRGAARWGRRAMLETYRQKFPAHLDADRFTLEP